MNERWAQVRERLMSFWNQYSKTQKWVLASTAVFLLLAVILLTSWLTRTQYEVAFQNLDSTDAAAIMQYLDGQGISYKLSADGSSISVPSASAARARVDVGSQGLLVNGSIGFKELSESSSSIGTTQEEFQVKLRNALNGEVQQLLQSKQGVQRAKVLINLPQETVFASDEDKEKASASVVLTFKPGFRPKQEEVDSYFNLVKTAVPNLSMDGITIASTTAGELEPSDKVGGSSSSSGAVQSQFELTHQFENEVKKNIQQFLIPMVGMDNMVISVVSTLNFDKKSTEANTVVPLPNNDNNGIVISKESTTESSTGTDGSAGGVAGTGQTDVTNFPGGSSSSTSTSESTHDIVNYEPSRVKDLIESAPYKVKDVSINVGIDSTQMTPEKTAAIQQMLVGSVRTLLAESGQTLNDQDLAKRVSVISQTFNANAAQSSGLTVSAYWLAGLGVLAAALLGGGGYYVYRRRKAAREAAELAAAEVPRVELPTIDIDNVSNESQVRKQLENLAKRKPEEFVNLLRTWLVDE
ncbi:flagellar basal-body MS-ring/collar protein FliF [Cohnella candidum]|uniref:Flagellar M-ring protein n=1 Tax=Cohnella candidum TaxID=2674991 RepID=A0A3G3JUS1_9BACL|nr:flagellar basal-body MS-ring/collar protein FliF [Cohnella candidum]AYQ71976.1 flagellar M-ring protein FliF [Cohnella candidum]